MNKWIEIETYIFGTFQDKVCILFVKIHLINEHLFFNLSVRLSVRLQTVSCFSFNILLFQRSSILIDIVILVFDYHKKIYSYNWVLWENCFCMGQNWDQNKLRDCFFSYFKLLRGALTLWGPILIPNRPKISINFIILKIITS